MQYMRRMKKPIKIVLLYIAVTIVVSSMVIAVNAIQYVAQELK